MTIESIIRSRTQVWADLFHDYGYEPNPLPARVPRYPSELLLRADKMTVYGNHPCSLTITELWQPGTDSQGLVPPEHGCYLAMSAWHAQCEDDEVGAERLDLDRNHVGREIHRHPYGGTARVAEATLLHPEQWIIRVETVLLSLTEV